MISDWSDLQTVLAIARHGNLSAAARELNVNQSTVSRRLAAVERRLDKRVFEKIDGRLRPTATGAQLLKAAEAVAHTVDAANQELADAEPTLRFASCEVLTKSFLVPMLRAWHEESGGTGELVVYDSLFDLSEEAFDILLTPRESAPEDLVGRRVGMMPWGLYASPGYVSAHDVFDVGESLEGHNVIRSSGALDQIAASQALARLGGRTVMTSTNLTGQLEAAAQGLGVAALPDMLVAGDLRLVRVADLPGDVTEVWMAARRAVSDQPRVRAFLKWSKRYRPETTL